MAKLTMAQKEISASYMVAEFNAIQERAINLENLRSSRINYFLITTGAVVAGLSAMLASTVSINPQYLSSAAQCSSLIILTIGLLTLHNTINDSVTIVYLWRYAARIRRYFTTVDESLTQYLPFPPNDNKPEMANAPLSLRGSEASLLVINATALSVSIFFYLQQALINIFDASIVAILAFPVSYFIQIVFIKGRLFSEERASSPAIKFPIEVQNKP